MAAKTCVGEEPASIKVEIVIPRKRQNLTGQRMTFVKINGAEHKPNGRTINIKYLNFRAIIHKNPRYFW